MFDHQDVLSDLNQPSRLSDKLQAVYVTLRERLPFIDHISVALYDEATDWLKTFLNVGQKASLLLAYQAKLSDAHSLSEIVKKRRPRVLNDLQAYSGDQQHTKRILESGFQASYTLPIYFNDIFFGFVFFNSAQKNAFTESVLDDLDYAAHLVALLVVSDINSARNLMAAAKTASAFMHLRDLDTGYHLDRMANYARLIAKDLGPQHGLDDEYAEYIFLFSPLHDIGKIGIPDRILLKNGSLTSEEITIMHSHTTKGVEMIDTILCNFGLAHMHYAPMLRNVVQYHHELVDGSGYPHGLQGEQIPLEARITSVADNFDALTTRRVYKDPWPNDRTFDYLRQLAGTKFDTDCVEALIRNKKEIEQIQENFREIGIDASV